MFQIFYKTLRIHIIVIVSFPYMYSSFSIIKFLWSYAIFFLPNILVSGQLSLPLSTILGIWFGTGNSFIDFFWIIRSQALYHLHLFTVKCCLVYIRIQRRWVKRWFCQWNTKREELRNLDTQFKMLIFGARD